MCLESIYSEKYQKRLIKQYTKNGYIRVYKTAFNYRNNSFMFPVRTGKYKSGLNKASGKLNKFGFNAPDYKVGFHSYFSRSAAVKWEETIIECFIKPKWINTIGRNGGRCVVSSKIYMPTFPKTKPLVKDFKRDCK